MSTLGKGGLTGQLQRAQVARDTKLFHALSSDTMLRFGASRQYQYLLILLSSISYNQEY